MEYVRVAPNDGETFADVTARLDIEYYRGSGYYKLIKPEKISATKDLVLKFGANEWIAGGSQVRSQLGLGSGAITINSTDLPVGNELFVQSTSHNRRLKDGHDVLFRKSATPSSGKVAVTTLGDDDDNDGGGVTDKNDDHSDAKDDNLVIWSKLIFPLEDEVECLDESSLVVGANEAGCPGDCDLPVPANLVKDAISVVQDAFRSVQTWTQTEAKIVTPSPKRHRYGPPPKYCRYQWQSADKLYRVMYVDTENATFMALENLSKNYGLVAGNCQAHPFVHSPEFSYANSDGSSSDINLDLDYLVTPELVLAKLIHDTVLHCANGEH